MTMNFRRRRALGFLAAVGICGSPIRGWAQTADAGAAALLPDDVRHKGTLVVAMPLDFEPFNSLDSNNKPVGLDVDVFDAVCGALGLKPDIQRLGFASIIPAVTGGRVDVGMSAMSILPARLQQLSFVRYARAGNGLIVRKGNPTGITTTEGCGHSIAGEKGTQPLMLWQEIAKQCEAAGKPKIDIMVFDGKGPQVLAVQSGRAEAAAVTYATATVSAEQSGGRLEAAPGGLVPGGTTDCGIAFNKDHVQLGRAIEAALKVLQANGTYDRLFAKWDVVDAKSTPLVVQASG